MRELRNRNGVLKIEACRLVEWTRRIEDIETRFPALEVYRQCLVVPRTLIPQLFPFRGVFRSEVPVQDREQQSVERERDQGRGIGQFADVRCTGKRFLDS